MKNKRITTAEIAKKLHLSQPTVSRALNPVRAWMVNIRTREKIRNFCLKAGVIDSISSIHSKTARAAFVLGDMEADLFHLNKLIGSLTLQLQNYGCSLSMIRVTDARDKVVRDVKRILTSDIADVFIINPCFLTGQNPKYLHQVSSRLVLSTPFMGLNDWLTERKWLSGIYYDYGPTHRLLIQHLRDDLMEDIVYFGSAGLQSRLHINMLRSLIRKIGRKSKIREWCFDFDTDFGIVSYRTARQAAARQFNDHAGHKLYWTAGFTEGLALYDELTGRGLKHGRDYHMITYGSHQAMGKIIEEELPHFELNNLKRAGLLCELILSQLEKAVPRQIPVPVPFYPGNCLPELKDSQTVQTILNQG